MAASNASLSNFSKRMGHESIKIQIELAQKVANLLHSKIVVYKNPWDFEQTSIIETLRYSFTATNTGIVYGFKSQTAQNILPDSLTYYQIATSIGVGGLTLDRDNNTVWLAPK